MAKVSAIERNKRRAGTVKKFAARRARLKAMTRDASLPSCRARARRCVCAIAAS